ncbi:metal-sensitive transcriptional regulator [Paenibacillus sp. N1-5-1-14]|uniref:metal-sensitive transcriptional regulator n=1 Tax=Paenibacillus radicibacter TaxID=2972488 RepID=UPI002159233C|nr:metal-sensitive transcriptional regulator [Paenibacillus radicibacter]MCR8642704.1 metal-sensitive transcriptional regulator [Paenibacillus radicibacter]
MEYSDSLKNRLRRIEGQIRGVLSMMENEKDCREIVTQLSAIRTAVDRSIGLVVGDNLSHCIKEELEKGNNADDVIQQAVNLLVKTR